MAGPASPLLQRWAPLRRRWLVSLRRARLVPWIAASAGLAFLTAMLTAAVALRASAERGGLVSGGLTATLLIGMMVPGMALLVLLGRWLALRRAAVLGGGTGRMHVQLVSFFSLIASFVTLLVAIFASLLFQSGVEFWFSDSSRGLLENANKLARGYYEQTQRDVSENAVAMAADLNFELSRLPIASVQFQAGVSDQVIRRKFDDVAIVQKGRDGAVRTLAFANPGNRDSPPRLNAADVRRLDAGEPIIVKPSADRIEAVAPIDRPTGLYLYVARKSDLLALSQGRSADNIVRAYQVLTRRARLLQLRFNIALLVASLALVGFAVWVGLRFADRQVQPLYRLVDAAGAVGEGNFALRVEGRTGADEIGLLNRAFNRMTAQIERQTQALVGANQQLDERRSFIEAVLQSVTAGIVSLDRQGQVRLMNSSACQLLLGPGVPPPVGQAMAEISPAIAALLGEGAVDSLIQHTSGAGELRTLAVRVTRNPSGHVITFEDITRRLLDQRAAAWSDVARRIAHEIKNPLTPIQLATERLSRRYRRQIATDGELFEELTSTIIRQVGDLRKMVDEFSSFARLPKPVFRGEDPVDLARQALFLQEVARPDISFAFAADADIAPIACDRHQFGQAMTNVLKNSVEAVESKSKNSDETYRGKIRVTMRDLGHAITVAVADNGIGLPQDRERIVEPYVTTRDKGTGLGLAIVKKIIEEHGGEMTFEAGGGADGGTVVTMRFARDPLEGARPQSQAAE
ncbi:MAG: HAMP domain-containing protein [Proteobacteria bacterium]|nr:HAMP domain-containing protein [Pseudomonadota bacterium]